MHERAGSLNTDDMVMWFDQGNALQVDGDVSSGAMVEGSLADVQQRVITAAREFLRKPE